MSLEDFPEFDQAVRAPDVDEARRVREDIQRRIEALARELGPAR